MQCLSERCQRGTDDENVCLSDINVVGTMKMSVGRISTWSKQLGLLGLLQAMQQKSNKRKCVTEEEGGAGGPDGDHGCATHTPRRPCQHISIMLTTGAHVHTDRCSCRRYFD
jgi:hypothetical protein